MKIIYILILFLNLLFFSTHSFAINCTIDNNPQNEVANLLLNKLIQLIDWEKLTLELPSVSIQLCSMLRESQSVQFLQSLNGTVYKFEHRKADFYIPGGKVVIFNPEWTALMNFLSSLNQKTAKMSELSHYQVQFSLSQFLIMFHAMIGATGYFDENYDKTIGFYIILNLYSSLGNLAESNLFIKNKIYFKKILNSVFTSPYRNKLLLAEGGSTGVSGGGDIFSLMMKLSLLEYEKYYESLNSKCSSRNTLSICSAWASIGEYITDILDLNIESVKGQKSIKIHSEMNYDPITISIPKMTFDDFILDLIKVDRNISELAIKFKESKLLKKNYEK